MRLDSSMPVARPSHMATQEPQQNSRRVGRLHDGQERIVGEKISDPWCLDCNVIVQRDEGLREDGKRCCASITTSGLRVYMKQSVSFAGIALSLL